MGARLSKTSSRDRSGCLICAQAISLIFTGALTAQFAPNNDGPWVLFSILAVASFLALVLRLGWLIPCTVMGVIGGLLLDPPVKGGPVDAQMWETATNIALGTIAGLAIGLVLDLDARKRPIDALTSANGPQCGDDT